MHPFRQCKTVNCAGHVYVRKQHIYRDTIQDADRLSAIRCLDNVEARVAHVARRHQTQKNIVFHDKHNRQRQTNALAARAPRGAINYASLHTH